MLAVGGIPDEERLAVGVGGAGMGFDRADAAVLPNAAVGIGPAAFCGGWLCAFLGFDRTLRALGLGLDPFDL